MNADPCGDWQLISKYLAQEREPVVRHRLSALGAMACGCPVGEVAKWYGVSRQTLYNWMERFGKSRGRPDSLLDAPRPGRPAQWEKKFSHALGRALKDSPEKLGYPNVDWTVELLREHLADRVGRYFSVDTVRRQVHRLGYVWKRPRYTLEADPQGEKKSLFKKTPAIIA